MAKSFLCRYFGIGKMPANWMSRIEGEGIVEFDECIRGSLTYRNFHRPGAYSAWRKVGLIATVALTNKSLIALNGSKPVIDVPLDDERLKKMRVSVDGEKLLIAFDADLFQPTWSGQLEYRFKTEAAWKFVEGLKALTA
jgi:hypothetical protein